MKVPKGPGLGVELDEDAVARYRGKPRSRSGRAGSRWSRSRAASGHYYRDLRQAEGLMKLGVDEAFAPGVRLDEWEDDGSEAFDRAWRQLRERAEPIWETE